MALNVGSRLGHYDVTALIGEGGMGQVYRATDTQLGRDVALKILPEAFAADPERLARFQREAQVLANLNHPNIAARGWERDCVGFDPSQPLSDRHGGVMAINCCRHGALLVMFLIACGCSAGPVADSSNGGPSAAGPAILTDGEQEAIEAASSSSPNPLRNAYFGDLHVHTRYSFDAYVFKVRGTPDDAYRYAKGEPLTHPTGHTLQLRSGPLDFQAVTDHGLYLGAMLAMDGPESPLYEEPLADELRGLDTGGFARALEAARGGELAAMDTEDATLGAWQDIVAAAERHNDPGTFTTFVGYDYTLSADDRGNLHRNVIFRGDAPDRPFAVTDSRNPADLALARRPASAGNRGSRDPAQLERVQWPDVYDRAVRGRAL